MLLTSDLAGEHIVSGLPVAVHTHVREDKGLEVKLGVLLQSYAFLVDFSRRMVGHCGGKRQGHKPQERRDVHGVEGELQRQVRYDDGASGGYSSQKVTEPEKR